MDQQNTQRIYFKDLDTLRFIAAYMIVLLHCFFGWKVRFGIPDFIATSLAPGSLDKLEMILHNFTFGVDIFFIISGFLISYLLLCEREKTGKVDVVKFYIRRALRIWPLYFFILITAPLLTYFYNEQSPTYLYHFLFGGNFDLIDNGPKSASTNHLWSICIEEHFYLFCPLFIGFIPLKKMPQILLLVIFTSMIFRGFFIPAYPDYGMAMYAHTISRIDVLAIGALMGYLFYHNKIIFNHSLPVRLTIYSIFLLLFFNVSYLESGSFFIDTMKKYAFVIPAAYWIGNFLFNPQAVRITKPLLFNQFGKASYGIYMFNPIVIFIVGFYFNLFGVRDFLWFFLAVHAGLALVAFLSYRFFELPFLSMKEKYPVIQSGEQIKDDNEGSGPRTEEEKIVVNVIKPK